MGLEVMEGTKPLRGRVGIVTGSTRGIGREILLKLASEGADVVVVGKTTEPQPTLPGTIYTVRVALHGVKLERQTNIFPTALRISRRNVLPRCFVLVTFPHFDFQCCFFVEDCKWTFRSRKRPEHWEFVHYRSRWMSVMIAASRTWSRRPSKHSAV